MTGETARWHQALAYAVTGRRQPGLGEQPSPSVAQLAAELRSTGGDDAVAGHVRQVLDRGQPWPHPVPPDLMQGLSFAQFTAALGALRAELGLTSGPGARPRVGVSQAPSANDRRLLEDVPPHHGGG